VQLSLHQLIDQMRDLGSVVVARGVHGNHEVGGPVVGHPAEAVQKRLARPGSRGRHRREVET
jgi:hypothetical protein